ncbi:MAG: hypothetical protein LIP23_07335, partial [Planctomycetes bacterium]|nr:hypothetical protein [Planctomycetota bacterium]
MTSGTRDFEQTSQQDPEPNSVWRRLLDYVDWKINPVLLRDLRMYAKGKKLPIAYMVVLASLVLMAIGHAVGAHAERESGQPLLYTLVMVLCLACGAFIPNLVFERFRSELANRATELALMSPLTPARLVFGKLSASWCMVLLMLSVSAPMLATAYLLGGVNLLTIIGIVTGVFIVSAAMPTVQLFMATQRRGRGMSRIVASIVFIGQFIAMISFSATLYAVFVDSKTGLRWRIGTVASVLIFAVLVGQYLYCLTVSRLRSVSEDRDAVPRLSLAAAALLGAGCAVAVFAYASGDDGGFIVVRPGYAWPIIFGFVSAAFCLGFVLVSHT